MNVIHKHETFHIVLILNRLPFLMKVYNLWPRIEKKLLKKISLLQYFEDMYIFVKYVPINKVLQCLDQRQK